MDVQVEIEKEVTEVNKDLYNTEDLIEMIMIETIEDSKVEVDSVEDLEEKAALEVIDKVASEEIETVPLEEIEKKASEVIEKADLEEIEMKVSEVKEKVVSEEAVEVLEEEDSLEKQKILLEPLEEVIEVE